MEIGRKIYFDKATGEVIFDTGEREGDVIYTSIDQDIATFKVLSERNRNTFDVIELEYGQLSQDFTECNSCRVNVELLESLPKGEEYSSLEFSYPDPNDPEELQVFQKPLSEEIKELKQRQNATDDMVLQLLMEGMM